MAEISEVPGITGSTLELFRLAGLKTVDSLVSLSVEEILGMLDEANTGNEAPGRRPSQDLVRAWQNAGRSVMRKRAEAEAPAAKIVPEENLRAAGIDVSSVPVAKMVEPPPEGNPAPAAKEAPAKPAPTAKQAKAAPQRPSWVKFRQLDAVKNSKVQGERRNRGMSHPGAGHVRLAAAVTIIAPMMSALTAIALFATLVMDRFYGWEFPWTIALLLLVFPVSLILYLSIGVKARCRLCGQKLFVPRRCRKHERASKSIFGHTFAVARNAMVFGSYRCMLCGVKTRLTD
ncbi:MAG: hypothetical protein VCA73_03840 [Roseibacillus sp.]|jgi:hypothetical protein